MVIPRSLLFTLLCLLAIPARAAPPLSAQVDRLVEARAAGKLAGVAEDAEFLRRVWLDLAGIVPTADQVRAFLSDRDRQKRGKMIDQLLASGTIRPSESVLVFNTGGAMQYPDLIEEPARHIDLGQPPDWQAIAEG